MQVVAAAQPEKSTDVHDSPPENPGYAAGRIVIGSLIFTSTHIALASPPRDGLRQDRANRGPDKKR